MTVRFHLFPFRTQKLSSLVPKIVRWKRRVKIGSRRLEQKALRDFSGLFCCILHLFDFQFLIILNPIIESGVRTVAPIYIGKIVDHFYLRFPCRGCPVVLEELGRKHAISIHALREEGDTPPGYVSRAAPNISIHALREEGDLVNDIGGVDDGLFLSTPSARRATSPRQTHCAPARYFYPRPPRGGRPRRYQAPKWPLSYFYPRPPRGGRLP